MARIDLLSDAPAPLPEADLVRLRALTARFAPARVGAVFGVSRTGILTAAAGMPVIARLRKAITEGLADCEGLETALTHPSSEARHG